MWRCICKKEIETEREREREIEREREREATPTLVTCVRASVCLALSHSRT